LAKEKQDDIYDMDAKIDSIQPLSHAKNRLGHEIEEEEENATPANANARPQ